MRKQIVFFAPAILCLLMVIPPVVTGAEEKGSEGPAISEFRAFSQFRSVKLVWQSNLSASDAKSFQISRSIYQKDGPYTPLASVGAKEGERSYTFVDKDIQASDNYYYKITVEGTGETFGPSVARPFLYQPAT